MNNDYYKATEYGGFIPNQDYQAMSEVKDNITLKIVGILRAKSSVKFPVITEGIAYSDDLAQRIIDISRQSDIVKSQEKADINVMTMEKVDDKTKEQLLSYLGGNAIPYMITIYPINFETKDDILSYLDAYNDKLTEDKDKIIYTDMGEMITNLSGGIMTGITMVLIAFASISLIVSPMSV
jgi:putative ABC transport system permease protein